MTSTDPSGHRLRVYGGYRLLWLPCLRAGGPGHHVWICAQCEVATYVPAGARLLTVFFRPSGASLPTCKKYGDRRGPFAQETFCNDGNWRNTRYESGLMGVDEFIDYCLTD